MYFLNLPAFNPKRGINTDQHYKYPFLSTTNGLFEPDDYMFNFNQSFKFELIAVDEYRSFYLSEPNLIKVFTNHFIGENPIRIHDVGPIDKQYTQELKVLFYDGYQAGFDNYHRELTLLHASLDLVHKKELLKNFISYCHIHLYFEGFAIPAVLYALGYLQANLVRAIQDFTNLNALTEIGSPAIPDILVREQPADTMNLAEEQTVIVEETLPTLQQADIPEPVIISDTSEVNAVTRIILKHPVKEIKTLWYALVDTKLCNAMSLPPVFSTKEEIDKLLGSIFESGKDNSELPSSEHRSLQTPGYKKVLCLLMHATYKLNDTYTKTSQLIYCEMLKRTFSAFDDTESAYTLKSNMTKNVDDTIAFFKKADGKFAKEAYGIITKVSSYRLKP